MPFLGESGLTKDKHQLLGEILEEGAYADKSTFEKSKIILSNSTHLWEDVIGKVTDHGVTEDTEFMRNMANTGSLDLSKKHGVSFGNVHRLRDARSQLELEDTVKDIKRREEEERQAGLVSKSGTGWSLAHMGMDILGDPLLLPMMAMPELAPSRFGMIGKAGVNSVRDASMFYGWVKGKDYLEGTTADSGELWGNTLAGAIIGGGLAIGTEMYRTLRNSAIDEVTGKALTVNEGVSRAVFGNKDIVAKHPLARYKGELVTRMQPILQDLEKMRADVETSLRNTPYSHLVDDVMEIWKHRDVESIMKNPNHPLMRKLHDKMRGGAKPYQKPKVHKIGDGEAIETSVVKKEAKVNIKDYYYDFYGEYAQKSKIYHDDIFKGEDIYPIMKGDKVKGFTDKVIKRIEEGKATKKDLSLLKKQANKWYTRNNKMSDSEYIDSMSDTDIENMMRNTPDGEEFGVWRVNEESNRPLDNLSEREADDLFTSKKAEPHPITKYYNIEGVDADMLEDVLKRGEAVREKGAKNSHITINADGSRTVDRIPKEESEYFNSWLTPTRVKRIRAGKATDKDLEHLVADIEDMQSNPFLSVGLSVGALTFLATGEVKADDGGKGYSPLDLIMLAGIGALGIKYHKNIGSIASRINSRLDAVKRAKNILKFDAFTSEGFGIINGTKAIHNSLKNLKDSPLTSKMGKVMLENLKSIMENNEGVIEQVSALKDELRDRVLNKLYADVAKHVEDFKKETNFKSLNPVKHIRLRERFYEQVGEAFTRGEFDHLSPSLKKAVESFKKGFDTIYQEMKDANVKGMEDFEKKPDYFPRYHNPSAYDFISSLKMSERTKVKEWYANAIKRGFAKELKKNIDDKLADKLAKQLLQFGQSNNMLKALQDDSLFSSIDLANIDKQFGRTMFRVPLDFSVKGINVGGRDIELVDFMDTNAYSVMNRYANQASGHYGFAKHGIPSVDEAIKAVEKEFENNGANLKVRDSIIDYANSIIGRPIVDGFNRGVMDVTGLISKATSTQMLHLSGITTMSEVVPAIAQSLAKGTFGEGFKAFIKAGRTALEDIQVTNITEELMDFGGYGGKRVNARESFANPKIYTGEDFAMNSEFMKGLDRGLTAMQKVTFIMNQLPFFEDFANMLNLKNSHNTIKDHILGKKLFNKRRAEAIGLNPSREQAIKDAFVHVTEDSMNFSKWTEEQMSAYKTVLTQMQRSKVGQMVMGDLPLAVMKNPIYKMAMTLLSFPIQSFDNLLLRDMYARDGESIFRFKSMMMGTALSILMKDIVGGSSKRRKRDDEDLRFIERTIYGLPHIGIMSIASQLFNDRKVTLGTLFPTISVLENAMNAPKATSDILLGRADKNDRKVMLQLLSVPFAMQKILADEPPKSKTTLGAVEGLGATVGGLR